MAIVLAALLDNWNTSLVVRAFQCRACACVAIAKPGAVSQALDNTQQLTGDTDSAV